MATFSLEEDDYNGLFVTQEANVGVDKGFYGNNGIINDPSDFQSPCASLIGNKQNVYSDISDDDFEPFPSSQVNKTSDGGRDRYV